MKALFRLWRFFLRKVRQVSMWMLTAKHLYIIWHRLAVASLGVLEKSVNLRLHQEYQQLLCSSWEWFTCSLYASWISFTIHKHCIRITATLSLDFWKYLHCGVVFTYSLDREPLDLWPIYIQFSTLTNLSLFTNFSIYMSIAQESVMLTLVT